MSLDIHPIPFQADPSVWLAALAKEPFPILLDSNAATMGRYHIITASPSQWLSLNGTSLNCIGADVGQFTCTQANPEQCWQAIGALRASAGDFASIWPFPGGIAGFLGYDFGAWELLNKAPEANNITPALWVGKYDWALIADKHDQTANIIFNTALEPDFKQKMRGLLSRTDAPVGQTGSHSMILTPDIDKSTYLHAIHKIQAYIDQGDSYQVNYTQRFSGASAEPIDGIGLYRHLRSRQSAPFAAYLGLGNQNQILSFSPERLVSCSPSGSVLAQPIKGTIRRSEHTQEDHQRAQALSSSEKDRAENLMIVDLLRNDLSKVCTPYSVKVPQLFELQSFSNVHHLVSSIVGDLQPNHQPLDLLRACFPGGSITGAPKRRAMEIIQELEPHGRSAYCGTLFYLGGNNNFDANITIRTLVHHNNSLYCWGGGGITNGSEPEAEYQESLDKVAKLTNHDNT